MQSSQHRKYRCLTLIEYSGLFIIRAIQIKTINEIPK